MIEFTSGDILKDDVDAIVNTVNCVGIMGRGIALQFKNAWPENFKAYEAAAWAKRFLMVSATPLTRSSYHAGDDFARMRAARQAGRG